MSAGLVTVDNATAVIAAGRRLGGNSAVKPIAGIRRVLKAGSIIAIASGFTGSDGVCRKSA
jgi:hypothetical protein